MTLHNPCCAGGQWSVETSQARGSFLSCGPGFCLPCKPESFPYITIVHARAAPACTLPSSRLWAEISQDTPLSPPDCKGLGLGKMEEVPQISVFKISNTSMEYF